MIHKTYKFSVVALLITGMLILYSSCNRDLVDPKQATLPTTQAVFLDGFSAGLKYSAFGGSNVAAFDVDKETKYKGTESMRFDVPDSDDTRGGYAAGVFHTDGGRDLSGYTALTFWAKASESVSVDEIGFGFTFEEQKYSTAIYELSVSTGWRKYVIPMADPSKLNAERGLFYYIDAPEEGKGYTFWVDEVQFEKLGTIANPQPGILNGQNRAIEVETGEKITIDGLYSIFNLPDGADQRIELGYGYYTFSSSATSVAMVNEMGEVSVIDSGTAVITAKINNLDAVGSLTITSTGAPLQPLQPAPTPTIISDSVISLFSDAYDDVSVDTWDTGWEFSNADVQDLNLNGDNVKRYKNLNFVGIEFSSETVDATAMTHFHIDIWTPDPTELPNAFKILLVDFGTNGSFGGDDDSSHEIAITSPQLATEAWVSLDIPMTSFASLTNRANLAQMVLSGDLPNVFIDNVYFYISGGDAGPSEPAEAAPAPSRDEADVISIFSDAYTNVEGTDFNPNWGQATVVSEVLIEDNNTLSYSGLNFQGIQLAMSQDVSGMDFLHIDFWTANSSLLNAFLISSGPVETPVSLEVPTEGWTSMDIPLSSFSPVDLADLIQFKFDGNGNIFLDNIYFYKGEAIATEPTEPAPAPTQDAANVISIFSDAYTNLEGTDFNPDWGQSTVVTTEEIAGNNTLKYASFNYQGTQLDGAQDFSSMEFLHIDMWTADATVVLMSPISVSSGENLFSLTPIAAGQWNSYDIPVSAFTDAGVSLSDIHQLKFDGQAGTNPSNIYLDNIYFYTERTMATEPTEAAPIPTRDAAQVISLFSDSYTNIEGTDFNPGWGQSTVVTTEEIAGNNTLKYANFNFQGTQLAPAQDLSAMEYMHIDMWTADATVVQVTPISETTGESLYSLTPIASGQWNSYEIPLSAFTDAGVSLSDIHQLKFDGQAGTTPSNIYLDNIYFYTEGSMVSEPNEPAPTPTQDAANVISIFSDAYSDIAGTDFNPGWGQSTMVTTEEIAGDNALKYANFNFQGTQLAGAQDISAMEFMHIDMWTADATVVQVTPISVSSGESLYSLTPIVAGQWNSYEIPLSAFTDAGVSLSDIHQLKFDGQAGTTPSTIYLDNIYFYTERGGMATMPAEAAPTPALDSADVISIFSDAYSNLEGTNLNPDWGQATVVSEVSIDGNNTLLYSGLNYQGIELGNSVDVSGMTHIHLDFWTANSSALNMFLISTGPVETAKALTVPTSGWVSIDIPLTDFAPVNLADLIQFKFDGDGDIYIDNIYFRK